MGSSDIERSAAELHEKLERNIESTLGDIERTVLRPMARKSYACILHCYDDNTNATPQLIDECSRHCQREIQSAQNYIQSEVSQFQARLNRSLMNCNDSFSASITPDIQADPKKIKKLEGNLLQCISSVVDNQIELIKPLKNRIEAQLSKFK
jgi:membrane-associated HD superfamily phosphohydrolase